LQFVFVAEARNDDNRITKGDVVEQKEWIWSAAPSFSNGEARLTGRAGIRG